MLKTALAAVAALAFAGAASAAALTPEQIVHRHIEFAGKGDVDSLVGDYADDAVTITNGNPTVGKAAIKAQFAKMLSRPKGAAGAKGPGGGMGGMKVIKVWQDGPVGLVTWEAGPVHATEAFVVRNGKIQSQSVFMQGGPPPGPPAAK